MDQWWGLWLKWWDGEQLTGAYLWGHPLVMWARLGKMLQFAAGLTVLLDLIGPEPLRTFGQRLSRVPWSKSFSRPAEVVAIVIFLASFAIYSSFFAAIILPVVYPFGDEFIRITLPDTWFTTGWAGAILLVFVLAAATGLSAWLAAAQQGTRPRSRIQYWEDIMVALFLAPIAIAAAVVILTILLPWAIFIYGICLPASRGLAALLSRMGSAHPLRWIAFIIFVVGFHFDLLAS
jgi:hypothetical protein